MTVGEKDRERVREKEIVLGRGKKEGVRRCEKERRDWEKREEGGKERGVK